MSHLYSVFNPGCLHTGKHLADLHKKRARADFSHSLANSRTFHIFSRNSCNLTYPSGNACKTVGSVWTLALAHVEELFLFFLYK